MEGEKIWQNDLEQNDYVLPFELASYFWPNCCGMVFPVMAEVVS